ncbi:MAG: hypothetical protein JWO19_5693 [Bryobacterales bacterium]|jgi:hypothetical protein|nr:hypothetical protein [Bryobacterales bacterium]
MLSATYNTQGVTIFQRKKEECEVLRKKGGTGACVRCEEAGTRPSARVGLAMSVFTHGVN